MGVLDHKDRTIISADTITDITTSPGFVEGYVPPRPTVEQLVRRNIARLERRIKRKRERAAQYNGEIKAFNRALRQAEEDLKDFRELAQNVPHGQRLAVVLEVPAPKENRRLIQQEYHHVRGPVLRLLAEECAQEVEAAGYDEHARMYMKKGRDPARAEGHLHDAGLDHIVSQSLCGLWGATRVKDPLRDDHVLPKFRVNHVDNMYLTPWEQHHRKNKFLALQCGLPFKENSRRFKIYPVPEVNEKSSGFVCPIQPESHPEDPRRFCTNDPYRLLRHAGTVARRAVQVIAGLKQKPVAGHLLESLEAIALQRGRTVVDMPAPRGKGSPPLSLSDIFEKTVAHDRSLEIYVNTKVRPAIREAWGSIEIAVEAVWSRMDRQKKLHIYDRFVVFHTGEDMRALRHAVSALPFVEARMFQHKMQMIDEKIAYAFSTVPPPRGRVKPR